MSVLVDTEIERLCTIGGFFGKIVKAPMITPFINHQVREVNGDKVISYGLSSAGYDVRLDSKFKIFSNINSSLIDPLNFDETTLVDKEGDFIIIPPNSYAMGVTIEEFNIPRDIIVICIGKSTYARCGIIINVTPVEPGYIGKIVIEISNSTPLPAKVYANMGIAQFLFLKANKECDISYADKNGKYQGQDGVVTARV